MLVPEPGSPDSVTSTRQEKAASRASRRCAQVPHLAGVGDADLLHGAAGLHLADARERLEHGEDLRLADEVVGLPYQDLGQGDRPELGGVP
ncbi:MAG: hypothetical protein R2746_11490 [Acidimicrobiales bacterium]